MANSRVEYLERTVMEQRELIEGLREIIEMNAIEAGEAFANFTTIKGVEDGFWEISCNKGLWSVTAPTLRHAMREAIHYFKQYYGDGEYGPISES